MLEIVTLDNITNKVVCITIITLSHYRITLYITLSYYLLIYAAKLVGGYITMQVIASVEKYENAGMKFSTEPAFALAESELPMLAASS